MEIETGDIVGWFVSVLHDTEHVEMRGEVVAIHGNYFCIRSLHIVAANQDPFHGRTRADVHLIQKKAA